MAMMGIVMVINSQAGPLVIVYIDALMRIRAFTFDLSACNEQHVLQDPSHGSISRYTAQTATTTTSAMREVRKS